MVSSAVRRTINQARQIIERQRDAVKVVAEELLDVESIDATRLKELLAGSLMPAVVPSIDPSTPTEASLN